MERESRVTGDMVREVVGRLIERRLKWLADPIMVFKIAFIWINLILNADIFLLEQHMLDGLGEIDYLVKNCIFNLNLKLLSKKK